MPLGAATLAAGSTESFCSITGSFTNGSNGCMLSGADTASATPNLAAATVTAQVFSPARPGQVGAGANASVRYIFQVIGGQLGDIVPIVVSASLSASASEGVTDFHFANAQAALALYPISLPSITEIVCTDGCAMGTFSGAVSGHAKSGSVGDELVLEVNVFASGMNRDHDEFASASADPHIFIDPSFPNANLYSIIVSPGVSNEEPGVTPAVPEPGLGVPAGIGLGLLAVTRYLKRTRRLGVRG